MIRAIPQLPHFDPTVAWSQDAWPPAEWAGVIPLTMYQAWHQTAEFPLRPARVWLATTEDRFVVLAELEDHDITTSASRHNDPLWDLGDVFEIFVRHTSRPEYYEFHTAPNGVTLDLRYPRLYASRASGVQQYMLSKPHFTAQAKSEPLLNRWRLAIEIPVIELVPIESLSVPSEWQFSFCRYDCGPNRPAVVASTSPHPVADFHRGEDWLRFKAPAFKFR